MPPKASNITITERPDVDQKGAVYTLRTVTFMIGAHGPFTISGDKRTLTADAIKTQVQQHVDDVTAIEALQS